MKNDIRYSRYIFKYADKHPVIFLTVILAFISFFSWNYARGYYNTLGINHTFSHIDDIIFLATNVSKIGHMSNKINWCEFAVVSTILIGFSILNHIFNINIENKVLSYLEEKIKFKTIIRYIISFFILTVAILLVVENIRREASVAGVFLVGMTIMITIQMIWNSQTIRITKYIIPLSLIILIILLSNVFFRFGSGYAIKLRDNDYRDVDTICLSRKGREGFFKCGKKIHSTNDYYYIVFGKNIYPKIIKRDHYDATIIPVID